MTESLMFAVVFMQLPEALQGDENQSSAILVQTDPQRPSLPAHESSAHHS